MYCQIYIKLVINTFMNSLFLGIKAEVKQKISIG